MPAETPKRPLLARILPASLRSRLTLTVLIANVCLMIVGAFVLLTFLAVDKPNQAQDEARSTLQIAARNIEVRLELVDAIAATAAVIPALSDAGTGDAASLARLGGGLAEVVERSGLDAAALVSPAGAVVTAAGDEAGTKSLEAHFAKGGLEAATGLIGLGPNQIGVMSVRPLVSTSPVAGYLAVVQAIDPASITSPHTIAFENAGAPFAGDTILSGIGSPLFATTVLAPSPDLGLVRAELLGIDGRPVGWLTMDVRSDPYDSEIFGLSVLVASGLAVIVSLVVGVGLTVLIRRPLDTLVAHVHQHGHAALEGHPVAPLTTDPLLPTELRNLAGVYDRLLDHLARRQAEAAEATSALHFAVNDSFEAKVLMRDGHVVLVNAAAATILGLPLDRPLAEWDSALKTLELETEDGVKLTGKELVGAARADSLIAKVSGPDIPTRWVELRMIEHTDPRKTTLFTGRDVTEQRRINAVREEIVSLVSHDLRAPLTVIGGYLDLLERPLPEESREKAVTAAKRSAERMAVLLEDLLTATRAEEFFAPVSLDPVSLADLAEDAVSSFQSSASHELVATISDRGMVLGEERRLYQVLVNLVTNAIKHAPEASCIEVCVDALDGRVIASVQDDGAGIPVSERELVFERFTRIAPLGQNRSGIGLGLYIARAVVESHGGTVHVEDRPDGRHGARFVIDLPGYCSEDTFGEAPTIAAAPDDAVSSG